MTRRSLGLEGKVGLVLAAVLMMGIAGITVFAWREMRASALDAASQRLTDVSRQLGGMFEQAGRTRLGLLRRLAQNPAMVAYLRGPQPETGPGVPAFEALGNDTLGTLEVWNVSGQRLAVRGAPRDPVDPARGEGLRNLVSAERPDAVSPLYINQDSVRYAVVTRVQDGEELLGYVVQRQPVAGSAVERQRLMALIGSNAGLYVGNADGSVWSDFVQTANAPPLSPLPDTVLVTYDRPGQGSALAIARPMLPLPWVILVEFPRDEVLARTQSFLRRGGLIASGLFVVVGLLGWMSSRRVTRTFEGALEASEARFQAVIEGTPNGLLLTDSKGNIVLVNSEIERLFGYTRHELIGQPVERLLPKSAREAHVGHRAGYARNPEKRVMGAGRELFALRKDGTEFPVEIGLSPLEHAGEAFVVASLLDITTRKASDLELRRSNEELQRFAYVASHDLQEPLRTVASYVQLLDRRYKDKLDDDARDFIGFAVDGARRMQRLVEDLLTLSRVGSRGIDLTRMPADRALDAALGDLQIAIDESKAVVTRGPLPEVRGDASQLQQLFSNLVGNALKFSGDAPPRIEISANREGKYWVFNVRDYGIGIDPQYFDRIFVIFQRLHGRDEYPGTGIGLAICKKIVERHGGRIWVESQPGQGALFAFTLPAIAEN